MATDAFSNLPVEIHVIIAEFCGNNDLFNLCLTSKWVNEICWPILYRHVDLRFGRTCLHDFLDGKHPGLLKALLKRQQQFVYTLLSHPEYGKHVQSLKGELCIPSLNDYPRLGKERISDRKLWRAMRSLTHVQSVDIASIDSSASPMSVPKQKFPKDLFQSATSVTLVGHMQYGLAKSILNAINPAMLKYLCLDVVQEYEVENPKGRIRPGDMGEDGQIIALGVMSGLLTTLTGRCTALRTLILRRKGELMDLTERTELYRWDEAADEAAYIEWASFIRSVQGTLEKFTFEHVEDRMYYRPCPVFRYMDERFLRFILPNIVSGNWPCLTMIELRGLEDLNGQRNQAQLEVELRAVLGESVKIVLGRETRKVVSLYWHYRKTIDPHGLELY